MKTRSALFGIIVGMIGFAFFGFGPQQSTALASGSKPIKIAMHYSTTGWAKSLGIEELHGGLLAVEEINKAGGIHGRPLEPVITDLQSDYTLAVTVAKKMAADKDIVAAVGDGVSGIAMAMKPVYFEAHVPVLALVKAGPYTKGDFAYAYRVLYNDDWAIPQSLKLWKDALGIKTISLLHTSDAWGTNAGNVLDKVAPTYGIKVLSRNSYDPKAIDVSAQLIRIKAENPDAMVVWGYGEPIINVYKGARQIGLKSQILGPGGILDASIIKAIPEQVVGTIVADAMSTEDPATGIQKKFVAAFKAKYPGESFTTFSGAGYDAVYVLAQALKKVVKGDEQINRDDVKKALDQTDYMGTQGHFEWTPTYHDGPKQLVLLMAKRVDGAVRLMRYSH